MGRLEVEIDDVLLTALIDQAHETGLTVDEIVADRLRPLLGPRRRLQTLSVTKVIRERTLAGDCDADMADLLGYTPGRIAQIRRGLGLKANRRRWN